MPQGLYAEKSCPLPVEISPYTLLRLNRRRLTSMAYRCGTSPAKGLTSSGHLVTLGPYLPLDLTILATAMLDDGE